MDINGYGEQLEGESPLAFAFFQAFCDLGPSRTVLMLDSKTVEGVTRHWVTLYKWHKRFYWKERARNYDSVLAAHRFQRRLEGDDKIQQTNPGCGG